MKTLYLIRHSKSSWNSEHASDWDRALMDRGILDAHLVSGYIKTSYGIEMGGGVKYGFYSSSGVRAAHTALIFMKTFGVPASQLKLDDQLYLCPAEELQRVIRSTNDNVDTGFYFAHNPGVTNYINQYTNGRIDSVPTTGVSQIRFNIDRWSELGDEGELLNFDYPKKLGN